VIRLAFLAIFVTAAMAAAGDTRIFRQPPSPVEVDHYRVVLTWQGGSLEIATQPELIDGLWYLEVPPLCTDAEWEVTAVSAEGAEQASSNGPKAIEWAGCQRYDVDGDGAVSVSDVVDVMRHMGRCD